MMLAQPKFLVSGVCPLARTRGVAVFFHRTSSHICIAHLPPILPSLQRGSVIDCSMVKKLPITNELSTRYQKLKSQISGYGRVLVAFSGGVDSTLLLKVAFDTLGERCFAITCVSETMAASEQRDARKLGAEIGLGARHHILASEELLRPGFSANSIDRCALCKTELMEMAVPLAAKLDVATIVLGTNCDDLGDFRPGIRAASERGAEMPMVAAGLTKDDVRALSRHLGLRTWDKPQLACLSSRFPYGTEITPTRLAQVDEFEEGLRQLGFSQLRVRYHDNVARLEFETSELAKVIEPTTKAQIVDLGKRCGFDFIAVDLEGFRSGSLNPTTNLIQLSKSKLNKRPSKHHA